MLRRALNELFIYIITGFMIFYLGHVSASQDSVLPIWIGMILAVIYGVNAGLREYLSAGLEARTDSLQDFMTDLLSQAEMVEEQEEDI